MLTRYLPFIDFYIKWSIKKPFLKWPKFFPDVVFVFEQLEENDPFFEPGSANNERNYYNKLIH